MAEISTTVSGGATTTTRALLDLGGARLALRVGTSVSFTLFDPLGSLVGLQNPSRTLTDARRFDGYGETVAAAGATPNPWAFRGLLDLSPSGVPLYAMGARFYAPSVGTFTQLDTYGGSAADPASMNRYLYAEGNPATLIDPDGHRACLETDTGCEPVPYATPGTPPAATTPTPSGHTAPTAPTMPNWPLQIPNQPTAPHVPQVGSPCDFYSCGANDTRRFPPCALQAGETFACQREQEGAKWTVVAIFGVSLVLPLGAEAAATLSTEPLVVIGTRLAGPACALLGSCVGGEFGGGGGPISGVADELAPGAGPAVRPPPIGYRANGSPIWPIMGASDEAGAAIDRSLIATTISRQRQARHLATSAGGYFDSIDDAQAVLDAFHDGSAQVLGVSTEGHIVVRVPWISGTNVNVGAGFPSQPTNVFMIKGTTSVSIVPTNPYWTPPR